MSMIAIGQSMADQTALVAPLFTHADQHPDDIALVQGSTRVSYGELAAAVEARYAAFQRQGLVAGDAVLVLFTPSIDSVVTYWALHLAKAVVVVGDPTATKADWQSCIDRTGARFQTTGDDLTPTGAAATDLPPDSAAVFFSSGTTGQPKAIVHSAASLTGLHLALTVTWRIGPGDRVLGALPFHTIYGLAFSAGTAIYTGATLVLLEKFSPARALAAIQDHQITTAAFVPAMLLMILNFDRRDDFSTDSLRMIYSASAPISEADIARFETFSGATVLCNYGMTEIPGSAVEVSGQPHVQGAAGKICPGFNVAVRAADGTVLPVGDVGEVTLRGPSQMLGYLDAPDLTAERVRDGWVYTQDKGRIDTDGNITVLGRMSDMIIRGGLNISPLEIESTLSAHDAVADVAVVGPEDPVLGQTVSAFVVPRRAETGLGDALKHHCAAHLAPPKVPAEFIFTDEIPRNAAGKIDRKALLARHAARA